jgi:thiosulfate/3-mercaptopyruvate sulfurtransferase
MNSLIVSAQWLNQHLQDSDLAIADCRFSLMEPNLGRQQYKSGHIPGADYLDLNQDLSSPVKLHGGRHPLPDVEQLAEKLSQMGITKSTLVVAYDASRFAFAARLWWLLRYLGHDRVAILDGGWNAWQTAGYKISTQIPEAKSGQFIPQPRTDWLVDIEAVKARTLTAALVDSREPERYRGEREPIDPVAGHIPGAMNFPWQDVTTEDGFLRSPQELRDRWSSLTTATEILTYCGSGVTACVNLFSLAAIGIETGKLYAGSWSDWCSY